MRQIRWLLINAIFAGTIYMGFVENHQGAYNIAMFFTWLTIVISFFMLSDPVMEKLKENGRSMPAWINVTCDVGVTIALVWFGAWITGAFYLLSVVIQEGAWQKAADA